MGTTTIQKKISIVKGIVTVLKSNVVLYQSNSKENTQAKIAFTLPKDETDIQYQDDDAIPQIKPENIPSLVISVKDKNGRLLDTVANIVSKEGIIIP
jgi:hypothetical protein